MMRSVPTPARASREASADPVAPQPTMATREAASFFCPSGPMPGNSTCREYLSSGSKEVTSSQRSSLYYRFHLVWKKKGAGLVDREPPAQGFPCPETHRAGGRRAFLPHERTSAASFSAQLGSFAGGGLPRTGSMLLFFVAAILAPLVSMAAARRSCLNTGPSSHPRS